jgi:enamine deaminase RidA (YjgF/YER057c/UK114 family)
MPVHPGKRVHNNNQLLEGILSEGLEFQVAPPGLAPGRGYSHVATGRGRIVVIAGQVALDAAGELVGPEDVGAQARQVFENLRLALGAAGASFKHVVKLTYFVRDIGDLAVIREVRDQYVDVSNPPASSAVEVSALFRPDCLVEIEAFAICPDATD